MAPSCAHHDRRTDDVRRYAAGRAPALRVIEGGSRVGPNAVLQLIEALRAAGLYPLMNAVFEAAELSRYLDAPPGDMIPETEAARLHRALTAMAPPTLARALAADAGRRTADYVMANRIPAPARLLLKAAPVRIAAPMLANAIVAHAWTFCGSGAVSWRRNNARRYTITIENNGLATPGCPWHAAVFQRLFRAMVHPNAAVRHPACEALGDAACAFDIAL